MEKRNILGVRIYIDGIQLVDRILRVSGVHLVSRIYSMNGVLVYLVSEVRVT